MLVDLRCARLVPELLGIDERATSLQNDFGDRGTRVADVKGALQRVSHGDR